jgi:hypothetical protein
MDEPSKWRWEYSIEINNFHSIFDLLEIRFGAWYNLAILFS